MTPEQAWDFLWTSWLVFFSVFPWVGALVISFFGYIDFVKDQSNDA